MAFKFAVDTGGTLPTSLSAYWKLDEASGTREDFVGSSDLTDNNTVTQQTGKVNSAAQFTAANSEYLTVASNATLQVGDIDFAVACWVYMDTVPTTDNPTIIQLKQTPSGEAYRLYYHGQDGVERFEWLVESASGSTTVNANNLGKPSTGTWYFIVAWHDSVNNIIGIQMNNGTADTAAHTTGARAGNDTFWLGARSGPQTFWNGRIDEVGFWKKVLSSTEKTDLYNSGNGNELSFVSSGFLALFD